MVDRFRKLLSEMAAIWKRSGGSLLGAATAFGAALSLAPLLVIAIAVAGAVFGTETAREELESQLSSALGPAAAAAAIELLRSAREPRSSSTAALLGIGAVLVAATGFFLQVQTALNRIWEVEPREGAGLRARLRLLLTKRLLSFGLVMLCGLILLALVVEKTLLTALASAFEGNSTLRVVIAAVELPFSYGLLVVMLAVVYRHLPDGVVAPRHAWLGAALTGLLESAATVAVGIYLARTGAVSAYGAAGSVFALLIWLLVTSEIFFVGATFTVAHARVYGRGTQPQPHAVRLVVTTTPDEPDGRARTKA